MVCYSLCDAKLRLLTLSPTEASNIRLKSNDFSRLISLNQLPSMHDGVGGPEQGEEGHLKHRHPQVGPQTSSQDIRVSSGGLSQVLYAGDSLAAVELFWNILL